MIDLEAIKARCDEIRTPDSNCSCVVARCRPCRVCVMIREDVPALIAEVERLTKELVSLTRRFDRLVENEIVRASCCVDNELEVERLRGLVREVEWIDLSPHVDNQCPWCLSGWTAGHAPDCKARDVFEVKT